MMTEAIALGFGLYAIAAGIAFLATPERGRRVMTELRDSEALSFVCGILVFFIGAVLLVAHHKIDTALETFITILSALAVLEGLVFVALGSSFMRLMNPLLSGNFIRVWGVFALVAGVVLVYLGAVGH
ncbi:MAG: hypothetical protein ACFB0Z_07410 [Candidatus Phaeomarinobacter sp.]